MLIYCKIPETRKRKWKQRKENKKNTREESESAKKKREKRIKSSSCFPSGCHTHTWWIILVSMSKTYLPHLSLHDWNPQWTACVSLYEPLLREAAGMPQPQASLYTWETPSVPLRFSLQPRFPLGSNRVRLSDEDAFLCDSNVVFFFVEHQLCSSFSLIFLLYE